MPLIETNISNWTAARLANYVKALVANSIPASSSSGGELNFPSGDTLPDSYAHNGLFLLESHNWLFRFDADEAEYKWIFMGGPPLTHSDNNGFATTSTSFVDYTGQAKVTVPRSGHYEVFHGSRMENYTEGSDTEHGVWDGDSVEVIVSMEGIANFVGVALSRGGVIIVPSHNTEIKQRIRAVSGTADTRNQWIFVRPVKVK